MHLNDGKVLEKTTEFIGNREAKIKEILSAVRVSSEVDKLSYLKIQVGTNGYDYVWPFTYINGLRKISDLKTIEETNNWLVASPVEDIQVFNDPDIQGLQQAIMWLTENWSDNETIDLNDCKNLIASYPFDSSFNEIWAFDKFNNLPNYYLFNPEQALVLMRDSLRGLLSKTQGTKLSPEKTFIENITNGVINLDRPKDVNRIVRWCNVSIKELQQVKNDISDIQANLEASIIYMTDNWQYCEIGDLNDNTDIINSYPFQKSFDDIWDFSEFIFIDSPITITSMEEAFMLFGTAFKQTIGTSNAELSRYMYRISHGLINTNQTEALRKVTEWCEIASFQF